MSVPAKYRRACHFEAYVPDPLMDLALEVGLDLAGLIAEAESSIRALNQGARPALIPLARFLLKAESIASSKVEGLQLGVREIARAARQGTSIALIAGQPFRWTGPARPGADPATSASPRHDLPALLLA